MRTTFRALRYWLVSAKLTKVAFAHRAQESVRHSGIDVLFVDEAGDPLVEAGKNNGHGREPAHAEDRVGLLRLDKPAGLGKAFCEGEEGSCLRYRTPTEKGLRRDLHEPETVGGYEPLLQAVGRAGKDDFIPLVRYECLGHGYARKYVASCPSRGYEKLHGLSFPPFRAIPTMGLTTKSASTGCWRRMPLSLNPTDMRRSIET